MDSTAAVERQWRRWATEVNVDPDQVVRIAHGVRTIEVVRRLAPHLNADSEVIRIERREAEDQDGVTVMPGAADLLSALPVDRWAVVTSGTNHLATARLRLGRLPVPKVLVSADSVSQGKPHPEPYLRGAQMLGFPAPECLVIEDAPAGIRSAHAAAMKAIGVTSTYSTRKLSEADAIIASLRQLDIVLNETGGSPLLIKVSS